MRKILAAAAATLVALLVVGSGFAVSSADETTPDPIEVFPLTPRTQFTDDLSMQLRLKLDGRRTQVLNVGDPSRVVVARIVVQPGAQFPWHTHPGGVIVTVAEGKLVYVNANDCVRRPYKKGEAFLDPGYGNVHTAFNPSHDKVTELYAVFFDAPAQGLLTVPADVPPGHCDLPVGTHGSH
jgi:predicted metal-dependent enzyme (double-stranded beta helix superfamily)